MSERGKQVPATGVTSAALSSKFAARAVDQLVERRPAQMARGGGQRMQTPGTIRSARCVRGTARIAFAPGRHRLAVCWPTEGPRIVGDIRPTSTDSDGMRRSSRTVGESIAAACFGSRLTIHHSRNCRTDWASCASVSGDDGACGNAVNATAVAVARTLARKMVAREGIISV